MGINLIKQQLWLYFKAGVKSGALGQIFSPLSEGSGLRELISRVQYWAWAHTTRTALEPAYG